MTNLPIRFLRFWYPHALMVFIRSWRNCLMVLEEDLAVALMFKLLFVPLYHDASWVGRIISFFFRLTRVLAGFFVFTVITLFFLSLSLVWFLIPILLILAILTPNAAIYILPLASLFLLGISIFIDQILDKPAKTVWNIKSADQVWQATKLKVSDVTWDKLIATNEVKSLLRSLELDQLAFSSQEIPVSIETLDKTFQLAKESQAKYITANFFWVALLHQVPSVEPALLKFDLTLKDFESALIFLELKRNKWRKIFVWDEDFSVKHLKGINRGWLGAPTPALDNISQDLTKSAASQKSDIFIGKQSAISEVINILSQDSDRNVLLVGQPGVGKSALVNHLASLIIAGDAPEVLATKRLVQLDLGKLLSGVEGEGKLSEKLRLAFDEVASIENIIIYIDEIHNLGVGEAGKDYNLYSLLLPNLESNKFQFLASTEEQNYARILEKNGSMARLFHKIELKPLSHEDTIKIIQEKAIELAWYKKIETSYLAVKEIVKEAEKLIKDRVLPDSALSILEECQVEAKNACSHIEKGHKYGECNRITTKVVKEVVSRRTNIPVGELESDQKEQLLHLEQEIHEKFIDQEEAVKAIANSLRRSATSLREGIRPIGSFLFVGPTGVGKTELAKILSEKYFKSHDAFLRFDCSEYQNSEAITRLIGDFDNPGELTESVYSKPYRLILLDEFEKADPKILTLFLQILDDGRITDGAGKHIDFSSTIIIATSNVGSLIIAEEMKKGKSMEEIKSQVQEELLQAYKPELINRFDSIVVFKPLAQRDLEKIVFLKLKELQKLLLDQGYIVEFSPDLISELAKKGFDPILGARPLRRMIQDTLESRLSVMILENKLPKGETFKAGVELLREQSLKE